MTRCDIYGAGTIVKGRGPNDLRIGLSADEVVNRPQVFLSFFDLSDRPKRKDMRLIASGDRPSCLAACSSVIEDLASSINRRSSLNDQGLRAITETILFTLLERQSRQADPGSLDGFAWVGPGLGEARCKSDMRLPKTRNKDRTLS